MPNDNAAEYQQARVIHAEARFGGGSPPGPPLQPPSGGGPFDGMEARVARLEADVGHIKTDITDIKQAVRGLQDNVTALRIDAATLTERVRHLPTKGFIVTATTATLVLIGALVVFQGNIQRLFGVNSLSSPPAVTAPAQKAPS
jgi:hypothetical protein